MSINTTNDQVLFLGKFHFDENSYIISCIIDLQVRSPDTIQIIFYVKSGTSIVGTSWFKYKIIITRNFNVVGWCSTFKNFMLRYANNIKIEF